VNSVRESELRELPSGPANGVAKKSKGALSDDPVNLIMDRLGPAIVLISILTFAFLGLLEAAGSGIIESIIGPGFGLHGHGVLVYVMSIFAFGCIGGILGLIVALLVNAVLSIAIGLGSSKSA
jgi:hypothetical protein